MTTDCISVIVPVHNEADHIAACVRGLTRALLGQRHEILVCYDVDEDTTLPALARMEDRPDSVRLVRNTLGRGAAAAMRAGFQAAIGDVLVTTMADLSDPPELIPAMAHKIRHESADVVGGSRLKGFLSRAAGWSLRVLAGMNTRDATTNFRAYSRKFIETVAVESRFGMELALELTVKAHLGGFRVDEVPSSWKDRSAGESRFQLRAWLPRSLPWYLKVMGAPLFVWGVLAAAALLALLFAIRHAPVAPFWADEWMYVPIVTGREPFTLDWLVAFHNEHRIPLPKLLWFAGARLSGLDSRWGVGLNVSLLALAGAILLRAVLRFRGRLLWTDAFVSLLFLHWGHSENMTWPFQIQFVLNALLLAILLSTVLTLKRRSPADLALPFGLCLLAMPLCGAGNLPFVFLLAPWWIWNSLRQERRSRLLLSIGLPAAALLLSATYFVGIRRPPQFPPSPSLGASLTVALECLTGSLGTVTAQQWPLSGAVALGLLALSVGILSWKGRRRPAVRPIAVGLLLVLGGLGLLVGMIGHSRAGASTSYGFAGRYVSLTCVFPFIAYVAAEFFDAPLPGRLVRTALFGLMAALLVPNALLALNVLDLRRSATDQLLRDVRAGLPLRLMVARHGFWCPGFDAEFDAGLRAIAEARWSIYRDHVPPVLPRTGDTDADGTLLTTLRDGRIALELLASARCRLPLAPGAHEIRLESGHLRGSRGKLEVRVRVLREGAEPETVWSELLSRSTGTQRRIEFRVQSPVRADLEIKVEPAERDVASAGEPEFMMLFEILPPPFRDR